MSPLSRGSSREPGARTFSHSGFGCRGSVVGALLAAADEVQGACGIVIRAIELALGARHRRSDHYTRLGSCPALDHWLGHSTFVITTPGGKRIVTDPWLERKPAVPADCKRIDARGSDPASPTATRITRRRRQPSRARPARPWSPIYELALWLERKGLQNVQGMGIGGTVAVAGLEVTMVAAVHTSSVVENDANVYLGRAGRFRRADGERPALLFRGRHGAVRRHAAHRARCTRPEIAFLPIGDHYTMGPGRARRGALRDARRAPGRARCTTARSRC